MLWEAFCSLLVGLNDSANYPGGPEPSCVRDCLLIGSPPWQTLGKRLTCAWRSRVAALPSFLGCFYPRSFPFLYDGVGDATA